MDDVERASCRFQDGRDGHDGHEKPSLVHNSYAGESTSLRASAAPRGVTSPRCWNWVTRREITFAMSLSGDKCGACLLGTAADAHSRNDGRAHVTAGASCRRASVAAGTAALAQSASLLAATIRVAIRGRSTAWNCRASPRRDLNGGCDRLLLQRGRAR